MQKKILSRVKLLTGRRKNGFLVGQVLAILGGDRDLLNDILEGLKNVTVQRVPGDLDREVEGPAVEITVGIDQGIGNVLGRGVGLARRRGEIVRRLVVRGVEVEVVLGLEEEIIVDRVRDILSLFKLTMFSNI